MEPTETGEVEVTETCEKHGTYTAKAVELCGTTIAMPCPKCADERAKIQADADARADHEAKLRRLQRLAQGSLIPKRFESSDFASYQPTNDNAKRALHTCQKYANQFEERLQMGGGLVLCGKPGTGKTHLACAVANHVMHKLFRVALFTSVTKMTRAVKATYTKGSDRTEDQVIRDFVVPDLLILDEVGAQRGTDTELLLAQEILDERYQQVRPTILISNLSEDELGKYIGDRALDRMYEGGGAIIRFDWDSYRRSGNWRRFEQPDANTGTREPAA